MDLPPPELTRKRRPDQKGLYLIVPIDIWKGSVGHAIEDHYESSFEDWDTYVWVKRTHSYFEPHYDKESFKNCSVCQKSRRKFGKVPKTKIILTPETVK